MSLVYSSDSSINCSVDIDAPKRWLARSIRREDLGVSDSSFKKAARCSDSSPESPNFSLESPNESSPPKEAKETHESLKSMEALKDMFMLRGSVGVWLASDPNSDPNSD